MSDKFIAGMFFLQWFLIIVVYSINKVKNQNLLDLINLQGSELNAYVDLCKQQLDITKKLAEEHKSLLDTLEKEPPKEQSNNIVPLNKILLDYDPSTGAYNMVFKADNKTAVLQLTADILCVDEEFLFKEITGFLHSYGFIFTEDKLKDFFAGEFRTMRWRPRSVHRDLALDFFYGKMSKPSDVQHIVRDAVLDCDTAKSDNSSSCDNSSSSSSSE